MSSSALTSVHAPSAVALPAGEMVTVPGTTLSIAVSAVRVMLTVILSPVETSRGDAAMTFSRELVAAPGT
jgi:hypothetical protein